VDNLFLYIGPTSYIGRMNIKSVVFDYGSVLAWPPSSENCRRFAAAAGIPQSVLLERYFLERTAYDRDTIDDIEYWRNITKGYPASRDESLLRTLADLDVEDLVGSQ
jgi:hypothetical protein